MAEQKPTLLSPIIASTDASPNEEDDETRLRHSLAGRLLAGESVVGTGQVFEKWVALVRKRSGTYRFSGFPSRHSKMELLPLRRMLSSASSSSWSSAPEALEHSGTRTDGANLENSSASENAPEISLWERLGNSATLDIESSEFSWNKLSSLHHTEHTSSTEHSEDEMSKVMEVTINSGGVVFFAMFNILENNAPTKEAAAVIKIASSRMAIQSERLGYEFAKRLGVRTPQARLIHNSNPEWQQIKDAAEKARDIAVSSGDEVGEVTCIELLEALELSRCLLLMSYVHGPPMLDAPSSFDSLEGAAKTAAAKTVAALGRVLMLDLVLRNEDRLPCRHLGWRGNSANLLLADRAVTATMRAPQETLTSDSRRSQPQLIRELHKGKRAYSMSGRLGMTVDTMAGNSDSFGGSKHDRSGDQPNKDPRSSDFNIVAIDSGVPRRPPAGKRAKDQTTYPKFVELMLNNALHSSHVLHEITGGKVGLPAPDDVIGSVDWCSSFTETDTTTIVHEFRGGFRAALRELQGFHLFLLSIYQKLDGLLRLFLSLISKNSTEFENDEVGTTDSPATPAGCSLNSPATKDHDKAENCSEFGDLENHRSTPKYFPIRHRDSSDSCSPSSRENWHGKNSKGGSGEPRLRLTMKLREFNKFAKVDAELGRELEQWNDILKGDVIKVCQENNFNSGFFEGSDSNVVVDAYELKVRLEHILERITLISDAANTERPSRITENLFIGGTLCARSVNTLEYLGITHILCLCSNEIGQSDSQYPNMFEYKNLSISDDENADIGDLFGYACDYIDYVEKLGSKILVHCFEGRSRSATIVLAYLMLKKNHTLLEAWNMLKAVHRRAQPNDGFAKILLELDKSLHGKASMDWQRRRPMMRVCPMCGKNAGLSSSSLKLHLQKSHPKLSSGSVDSAMTIEIHKALDALKASRGGSVSPNHKHHSFTDDLSQISL